MQLCTKYQNCEKECRQTETTNDYSKENTAQNSYKRIDCVMNVLMSMISGECNCFLDYIENVVEFLPKQNNLTGCTRVSTRTYMI